MVDDGFGRNIECQFREAGVDTSHIIWFKPGGKEREIRHRQEGHA